MKKIIAIILSFISINSFSQEVKYSGVVVDGEKMPVELFTIVVTNESDTINNRYAGVFVDGRYSFNLQRGNDEKLTCLIYSLGYDDLTVPLASLKDTVVMTSRSFSVGDVVVKAKKEVTLELTSRGGFLYNVQNSVLSDMNSAMKLLSFIPGVRASDEGNVSVLGGSMGATVIYLDGVKVSGSERLLAVRSEDIKSVEVIRTPGARYKDAGSVILIKTFARLGFSSRASASYGLGDRYDGVSADADFTYARNKFVFTGAYRYRFKRASNLLLWDFMVDDAVVPGNWSLNQKNEYNGKNNNNWYYGQIKYEINDKHYIAFDYNGGYSISAIGQNSDYVLFKNLNEIVYKDIILKNSDANHVSNQAHLYYSGQITDSFSVNYNFDFSNRSGNSLYHNDWETTDVINETASSNIFDQKEKNRGYALTNELLFTHQFKGFNLINYGAEYAFVKDDVRSQVTPLSIEGNGSTVYKFDSDYLKVFAEGAFMLSKKIFMHGGIVYMYNKFRDNNNNYNGKNLNSFIPQISFAYYNQEKEFNSILSVKYRVEPPIAKALNDVTVTYLSPYEIAVGNSSFTNRSMWEVIWNATLKNTFHFGVSYKYDKNVWMNLIIPYNNDGLPLFIRTDENYKSPMHSLNANVTYNKTFNWGIISAFASVRYGISRREMSDGTFEKVNGARGYISALGRYNFPKNFSITIDAYYNSKGLDGLRTVGATYYVNLSLEKQFFQNRLHVYLRGGNLFANKYETAYSYERGLKIDQTTRDYGQSRYYLAIGFTWRFNNFKQVQRAKDNEYLKMLR